MEFLVEHKGYFTNAKDIGENTIKCIICRDKEMSDLVDTFYMVIPEITKEEVENRIKIYIDEAI